MIILCFLLFFSVLVSADQFTFLAGKSYEIDGRNITLVKFDPSEDKALFCVNGKKWIIEEDDSKTLNDVFIDVFSIKSDRVLADIDYRCKDCVCDESCDNSVCSDIDGGVMEGEPDLELLEEEIPEREVVAERVKEEVIEPVKISNNAKFVAILVLVVIGLGVVVLWRKH